MKLSQVFELALLDSIAISEGKMFSIAAYENIKSSSWEKNKEHKTTSKNLCAHQKYTEKGPKSFLTKKLV